MNLLINWLILRLKTSIALMKILFMIKDRGHLPTQFTWALLISLLLLFCTLILKKTNFTSARSSQILKIKFYFI